MPWGDRRNHGEMACKNCECRFLVKSQALPVRKTASLCCPQCGEIVMQYDTTRSYWLEPVDGTPCLHDRVDEVQIGRQETSYQCLDCGKVLSKLEVSALRRRRS